MPEAARVTPDTPAPRAWTRPALSCAVLAAATVLVYLPGITAGFVGDDHMILRRLRQLGGPQDALSFFGAEFFEYYRPLGFLAHAADYAIAGANPRQFHLTNILLHALNSTLVLLLGRRLSPRSWAGPLAALLFALHASNHEAVVWISARFDLLAATFALAALCWMTYADRSRLMPALLFGLAVLSKESAVALPLAAAAWAVFCRHTGTGETVRRVVPWLVALAVCAFMRYAGGGIPAAGGPGRLPKVLVFGGLLALLVMGSGGRWIGLREWVRSRRTWIAAGAFAALAAAAVAAAFAAGPAGRLASEKLAVAGFALFHLISPVIEISDTPFYLDRGSVLFWAVGALGLAAAAALVLALLDPLLDDDRMWFLATVLVAALLPISALTEGERYLYLPSAGAALLVGVLVAELRGARLRLAIAAVSLVLAVSVVEIRSKIRDWTWAGAMTAAGARLADAALAPACGAGHVVFLTSPVGVRGVYTHFYYETLELPRGCTPELFQVLVRVVRIDGDVDVRWDGPGRIVITSERYRGNFVLSADLRHFDRPLRPGASERFETPLGVVDAQAFSPEGARVTLTLSSPMRDRPPAFFYYSGGRIQPLAAVQDSGVK
jgi:hypothetical protein